MRRLIFLLVGVVIAGAIVVTVMDSGKAPPPEHGGVTADRLPSARTARLVAGPMGLVEKKDMAGAQRLFEADLTRAKAKGGLQAADLLYAFAAQLWIHNHKAESIVYRRRAVEAYRAAAPGSPELALALSKLGHTLWDRTPSHPPPEAVAALREALAIREKTLGRGNAETGLSYMALGAVEGLPAHTGRNPAKVAQAGEKIRLAIRLLSAAPNVDQDDLPNARVALVNLYARNGDAAAALKAATELAAAEPNVSAEELRGSAEAFEAAGDTATGRRLRDQFGIPDQKPKVPTIDPETVHPD